MKKQKLFEEFSPLSTQDWIIELQKELKEMGIEKDLVSSTVGNLPVLPFYNSENSQHTQWLKPYLNRINPISDFPGSPPRVWANIAEINVGNESLSNVEILDALQKGATGILLNLKGDEDMDMLLKDVEPQHIQVFLNPEGEPSKSLQQFFNWIFGKGIDQQDIHGGLLWDSFAKALNNTTQKDDIITECEKLLEIGKPFPQFKVLCLDSSVYHNAGASIVQELAFGMTAFIEILDGLTERNWSTSEIFGKVLIKTATGSAYFPEIAKLKLFRILIPQLAELYQTTIFPENVFIYCSTSYWTKTAWEVSTNMVRNTTEAMEAILGGCNALQVLHHDVALGEPSIFSKRMALNISSILKEECFLDKVIDPLSGNYYVQALMDTLFNQVKAEMIKIETGGGWWNAYQNFTIQEEVKSQRRDQLQALVTKKKIKIGVNKYQDLENNMPDVLEKFPEEKHQLKPWRESLSIELNPNANEAGS